MNPEAWPRQFAEEGYLGPLTLITPEAMAALRKKVEAFEAAYPIHRGKLYHAPHVLFPWLYDLLRCEPLVNAAASIFGPDVLLLQCGFRIKEPGDGRYVAWHQDDRYIKIDPFFVTTIIAFSENNEESGGLRVIPGSFREGQLAHRDDTDEMNMLTRGQEITDPIDEGRARTIALKPGQAVMFHARTIHSFAQNMSRDRRINIQVEFTSTAARREGPRDFAALVRGEDRYGHFDPLPQPSDRLDEAAFARHRQVVERRISESYKGAKRRSPALD